MEWRYQVYHLPASRSIITPITFPYHRRIVWFNLKAMDDIGVVMEPFGDDVTVILVVNSSVFGLLR